MQQENDGEFRTLNPVSKKAMYLGNAIVVAIVAAALLLTIYLAKGAGDYADEICIVAVVVALPILVYEILSPVVFFRYYRYRMDDDCIEVRRGVIIRSHSLVPVERVHQVQVNKGPILRKFGLANVTVTTAGGTVSLQYLDEPIAEDIAQNLNEKIIQMLKARQ